MMASGPQIYSTSQAGGIVGGIKALVYGKAGIGKTVLASTATRSLIIATEPGLLSLRRHNLPYVIATTVQQLNAMADWIANSREAQQFDTFIIDSLSEVLEILLEQERKRVGMKEPRKAYGELLILAVELIKRFRDIQRPNIIFTAKEEYSQDETGMMMFRARFPGKAMGIEAPYFFDEVWQLHLHMHNGQNVRALRCHPTNQHEAKDRSGALDPIEPAHLDYIFNKMRSN